MRAHTDISGAQPQNVLPAFRLIDDELGRVKKLIAEQLTGHGESVDRILGKFSIGGGKMLRPGLVLLSYHAVRDGSNKKGRKRGTKYAVRSSDAIIRVAAVVEMIHNATLLHDDVIDEGQKRRGMPTVNNLSGNECAVLLGDFLFSRVFKMCTDLGPRVAGVIAATAVQVCEGELRQGIQKQNWQLSESEYIDIISEKSGALFSGCCHLGSLLAGAGEKQIQSLSRFGRDVGIAFQIADDLMDIVGDESKTGKTLGSDADKNKLTLAVIHLLGAVEEKERTVVKSKLSNSAKGSKNALAEMLSSYGSLQYARSRAQEFVAKAIASLTELKRSAAKDALIETAGFMVNRTA